MMLELLKKYKEMILYIIFGGLTTLVNIVVYAVMFYNMKCSNMASTVGAWILSVLFAYITNKLFVFESKAFTTKVLIAELVSFFLCRLATGIVDMGIMYAFIDMDLLHMVEHTWNVNLIVIQFVLGFQMVVKVLSNVIVIILNYIASKLIIFKKEK